MKLKKRNSLRFKVWISLIIFSFIILLFLWIFQILCLDTYYKWYKLKELNKTVNYVTDNYGLDNYANILDDIAHDYGVCIEVVRSNQLVYISNEFNKGCLAGDKSVQKYKVDFMLSDKVKEKYDINNPKFNNKTLVQALKLDTQTYVFISASLEPLDATVVVLKNQFVYVTLIAILLSILISYYISKKITTPIEKITKKAKNLAQGNYNTTFEEDGINEINELSETLNYACIELNKTEDLRRELMANVSHDLKTPLTMIKAYAEMVRDLTYKDKEKREKDLNIIIEETDRLNLLVNDILDLSNIQAKTSENNYTTFDLDELINSIINRYDIWKEIDDYKIKYDSIKNIQVKADKKRIEQVIYNLINNAINYTGDNKEVIVKLIDNVDTIRVEITDTGKGIKDEDLKYIWDKYYKVDKTHSRVQVGTGIGLSIVKNILTNHNLEYGVISKINEGTTFYFVMNKEKEEEQPKTDKK